MVARKGIAGKIRWGDGCARRRSLEAVDLRMEVFGARLERET